jgi:hypothetical protein
LAEILEGESDEEVLRESVIVLVEALRAYAAAIDLEQIILADEGGVERRPEQVGVRNAADGLELNKNVAEQRQVVEVQLDEAVVSRVESRLVFVFFVGVDEFVVHAHDAVDLEVGLATCVSERTRGVWNAEDGDSLEILDLWTFDNSFVESLEVVDESDLARLADSHFVVRVETAGSEQPSAVVNVVEKPTVQKKAAARGACSTFARVAVDDHDVLGISFEPTIHFVDEVKEQMKRRSHVVLPVVVAYSVFEYGFVIRALADIEDPMLLWVSLV